VNIFCHFRGVGEEKKFFLGCSTHEKIFTNVHRVFLEQFGQENPAPTCIKLRIGIEK